MELSVTELPDTECIILDETTIPPQIVTESFLNLRQQLDLVQEERHTAIQQLYRYAKDLQGLRSARHDSQDALYLTDALYRLALLVEFRRGGSPARIWRVGVMSALLAQALGQDETYCDRIQIAAVLHDIGEIALPDNLMRSEGFTELERQQMVSHCAVGHVLLSGSPVPELHLAASIALSHHERWQGNGYPQKLCGEAIPLGARIVAVIDSFEGMMRKRPDRPAFSPEAAAKKVIEMAVTQFDPGVIAVFEQLSGNFIHLLDVIHESKIWQADSDMALRTAPTRGSWKKFRHV